MAYLYPPIDPPISGRDPEWTFEEVEARLVETLWLWRRTPDRDARFGMAGRLSSIWGQVLNERALIDAVTAAPRPLPLSRADIARRDAASEWLLLVDERDRRLVALALAWKAGGAARVPWGKVRAALGAGIGSRGIAMRYRRSVARIAEALNGAEIRANGVSSRMVR